MANYLSRKSNNKYSLLYRYHFWTSYLKIDITHVHKFHERGIIVRVTMIKSEAKLFVWNISSNNLL